MITSRQNTKIKNYLKLKMKKYRDKEGLFLVYGDHLVESALLYGDVVEILTSNPNASGTHVTEEIMEDFSQTETTFDILAVCRKQKDINKSDIILALDDVQDPDNVGALIRSAVAFGVKHIILGNRSADFYNEKTIRASQGAIFSLTNERVDLEKRLKELKEEGYLIVGADAHGEEKLSHKETKKVLVLGNEGAGISTSVKGLLDETITLPTVKVESLNVAIAGSIILYEWSKN